MSADRSYRRLIDGTILTRREYQQACTALGGRQRERRLAAFKELLRWKGGTS